MFGRMQARTLLDQVASAEPGEASAEVALITSSGARALRIRVNLGCKTSEFAFTRLLSNAAFGLFGFSSLPFRRSL